MTSKREAARSNIAPAWMIVLWSAVVTVGVVAILIASAQSIGFVYRGV